MRRFPSGKDGFDLVTPPKAPATTPDDAPKKKSDTKKKSKKKPDSQKDDPEKPATDMMCIMSGKVGFDLHEPKCASYIDAYEVYRRVLSKELLLQTLRREDDLLRSKEIQEKYSLDYSGGYHCQLITSVQQQALRECGVTNIDLGLIALRSARVIWKDDLEFIKQMHGIAMYMRWDISGDCALLEGSTVPPCQLVSLEGKHCMVSDFMQPNRPLVVVAGSYS